MPGIDLANLCNQAPVDGIHAVKIGPVIGTHVPWIVAHGVVRARLVEHVVAGDDGLVLVAPRKLLPKGNEAILIERNIPEKADARCVVRMPVDILPPLRRMKVENDIETMFFAVAQHFIETGKTRLLVFERSGIVLEVSIVKRYPDDAGAGLSEKDHIVFVEEVVEQALEEELCSVWTKHFCHLRPESMLRAWMPIDEILHVHPAAGTGSPEANLFPLRIDDVTAADMKELHLVVALMTVRSLWTSILFRCGCHSISRERCRTGKRGQLEKFTPWL